MNQDAKTITARLDWLSGCRCIVTTPEVKDVLYVSLEPFPLPESGEWSHQQLLLVFLNTFFMSLYKEEARKRFLKVTRMEFESSITAVNEIPGICLRPKISLLSESDLGMAKALVKVVQVRCVLTYSFFAAVSIEATLVKDAHPVDRCVV